MSLMTPLTSHAQQSTLLTPNPPFPTPTPIAAILPAILLPLSLPLAYFLPAHRLRPLLVLTALGILEYLVFTSAWPANRGDARALRYGVASSWIFVLPVAERAALHVPEREFWRLDDDDDDDADRYRDRARCPPDWTWEKWWWAVRLVATPRGVGWNFGGRQVNREREAVRAELRERGRGRGRYVLGCVGVAAVCYVVWDAVMIAERRAGVPDRWAWEATTLGRILFAEMRMGLIVYCGMTMQFNLAAAVGVGLGLNGPEEWPALFGNPPVCYTTANVWGRFWHQYIRQPCLGISHRLVKGLGMARRSRASYFVHLTNAFVISGFVHFLAVGAMAKGFYPLRSVISDLCLFFLAQPAAVLIERVAAALFARYWPGPWLSAADAPPARGNKNHRASHQREPELARVACAESLPANAAATGATTTVCNVSNRRDSDSGVSAPVGSPSAGKATLAVEAMTLALCRLAGYLWVLVWFSATGWWFVKAYSGVGMRDWKLPYSILERLFPSLNM